MKLLAITFFCVLFAGPVRGISRPVHSRDVTWIKFDEFEQLSTKDQNARLRNFIIELRSWKTAVATIVAFGGKTSCPNEAVMRASRVRRYLIDVGGLDPSRIKIVDAGYQQQWRISLYLAPAGIAPITAESMSYERPLRRDEIEMRHSCRELWRK